MNITEKKKFKDKYKVFTNEYDEIKNAEELENDEEISRLRKNLDQQLTNLQSLVAKLANKLQRQLLAKQNVAHRSFFKVCKARKIVTEIDSQVLRYFYEDSTSGDVNQGKIE